MILPFMDQAPLYNQLHFDGPRPGVSYTATPGSISRQILPDGRQAAAHQVPYAMCPSDTWPSTRPDSGGMAQASYTGSIGSQPTPSSSSACNPFNVFAQTFPATCPAGNVNYARSNWARCVSGMFSYYGVCLNIRDVTDGTSHTIFMGEVRPDCHSHADWGWWFSNSMGNAHASTVAPINEFNTCTAAPMKISNPACTALNNYNYSWGFKSFHAGGVHVLLVDGAVRFLSENIDHAGTYQRLGGRADGKVVGEF
jgi:hypothetical protein